MEKKIAIQCNQCESILNVMENHRFNEDSSGKEICPVCGYAGALMDIEQE